MIVIPFSLNAREYSIFVALQDDNVDRMKQYDSAQVDVSAMPPEFRHKRLMKVIVGWATTEDIQHVIALGLDDKGAEALQYLSRGFEFRPDKGDYDGAPLSVKPKTGEARH